MARRWTKDTLLNILNDKGRLLIDRPPKSLISAFEALVEDGVNVTKNIVVDPNGRTMTEFVLEA